MGPARHSARRGRKSAEARLAGAKLGYPVACKTATSGILHKSDDGGVRLDLANDEALLEAYRDLAGRLGRAR